MSESFAQFRRPFGESKISPSETALAGNSFRQMTKELYGNTSHTQEYLSGSLFVRNLDVRIESAAMNATIHQQVDMKTGNVVIDRIILYEAGETENTCGPKICDYATGEAGPEVRRYDLDGNARKLASEMSSDDNNDVLTEIKNASDGLLFEMQMGLNGGAIGVEEVNDLRNILSQAKPLPYDDSPEESPSH